MDKELIKMILMIMIIVCYFVNLLVMFCCEPLVILVANIGIWIIIIAIILGLAFIDWLNN